MPKRKERGTELSWAVPIDNEHVRGLSIVAWPLENGGAKPDWKPGTDTIADIRPGSFLQRSYEERQRKPDDLEAQEGQRPIAIHALENLAHSDTGIVMQRRLLREQLQRVEQGLDPINVMRDPSANKRVPTGAWNTIVPAEAHCTRASTRSAAGGWRWRTEEIIGVARAPGCRPGLACTFRWRAPVRSYQFVRG
jgi:hypothetical protein